LKLQIVKKRNKKETDEQFFARLINKQFEIAGHTDISYDILVSNKEEEDNKPFGEAWYQRYTTTKEKESDFKDWLKIEMGKRYKYIKGKRLDSEVGMFLLGWGLRCTNCLEDLKN